VVADSFEALLLFLGLLPDLGIFLWLIGVRVLVRLEMLGRLGRLGRQQVERRQRGATRRVSSVE
jgi:hypothetical protein